MSSWRDDNNYSVEEYGSMRRAFESELAEKGAEIAALKAKLEEAERRMGEAVDFIKFMVLGWREWDRREGQSPLALIEEEASDFLATLGAEQEKEKQDG